MRKEHLTIRHAKVVALCEIGEIVQITATAIIRELRAIACHDVEIVARQ